MQEEIFDVVDENDEVIRAAGRKEVHVERLMHRAVHILVFDEQGRLLVRRFPRSIRGHPPRYPTAPENSLY